MNSATKGERRSDSAPEDSFYMRMEANSTMISIVPVIITIVLYWIMFIPDTEPGVTALGNDEAKDDMIKIQDFSVEVSSNIVMCIAGLSAGVSEFSHDVCQARSTVLCTGRCCSGVEAGVHPGDAQLRCWTLLLHQQYQV